ncbi:peptidyl-tRNA hydrolase [Diutina catenulata]
MRVVVFSIGNPGPSSRHSVGHQALGYLASHCKQLQKQKTYAVTSDCDGDVFARSGSMMNESAKSFEQFVADQRINLAHDLVLILYDDFELDLGKVSLGQFKKNESHNGLRSIHQWCVRQPSDLNVYKLGVGIGPKPQNATKDTMAAWVLKDFGAAEKQRLLSETWPKLDRMMAELNCEDPINCAKITKRVNKPAPALTI